MVHHGYAKGTPMAIPWLCHWHMPEIPQSRNSQGKVRELKKMRKVKEKLANFDRLSEPKISTTLQGHLDDLSFCQSGLSRSQSKFSVVRENEG